MVRRFVLGILTVALALLVSNTISRPALAKSGELLLAEHAGMSGQVTYMTDSVYDLKDWQFNDVTSYAENQSDVAWVLFEHAGFSGRRYCLAPGQRIYDLGATQWWFGDTISSAMRLDGSSCAGYPIF